MDAMRKDERKGIIPSNHNIVKGTVVRGPMDPVKTGVGWKGVRGSNDGGNILEILMVARIGDNEGDEDSKVLWVTAYL